MTKACISREFFFVILGGYSKVHTYDAVNFFYFTRLLKQIVPGKVGTLLSALSLMALSTLFAAPSELELTANR